MFTEDTATTLMAILIFFNASVLNERYKYTNKPFTFEWNQSTNEIKTSYTEFGIPE